MGIFDLQTVPSAVPDTLKSSALGRSNTNVLFSGHQDIDKDGGITLDQYNQVLAQESQTLSPYEQQMKAIDRAVAFKAQDPMASKKRSLDIATERKKLNFTNPTMPDVERENLLRQQGVSETGINSIMGRREQFRQLDPKERFHNFMAYRSGQDGEYDSEFVEDWKTGDVAFITAKYGDEAGRFLESEQIGAMKSAVKTTATQSQYGEQEGIATLAQDFVGGIVQGVGNLGKAVNTVSALARTSSGSEERAQALAELEEQHKEFTNKVNKNKSDTSQRNDDIKVSIEELSEQYRQEAFLTNSKAMSQTEAQKLSEKQAEDFNWALQNFNQEMIASGLGEQVPQLVAGSFAVKIGSAIASGASKAILNQMLKAEIALRAGKNVKTLTQGGMPLAENTALRQAFNNSVNKRTNTALGRAEKDAVVRQEQKVAEQNLKNNLTATRDSGSGVGVSQKLNNAKSAQVNKAETESLGKSLVDSNKELVKKAVAQDGKVIRHVATKQAIKDTKTSALRRNKDKITNVAEHIGASAGIGAYAGIQDGTSAYTDAYNAIANAQGTDKDKIFNSPNFQKLKEENPNKTDREIQLMLAETAGSEAGIKSGKITALSAATIGSQTERLFAGKAGKSLGTKAKSALVAPVSEGGSETLEEYHNIVAPKEAVNNALGTNFYNKADRYALNQALEAGGGR